jgi:hypothetical protein
MNTNNYQKVLAVNGTLQAVSIQSTLEQAGIPTNIVASQNGPYLSVLVPSEWLDEAQNLLAPERCSGEIFYVPALN